MATQTRMTAAEKFQKYGEISRISSERFNRYKGKEYFFRPLVVDGQKVVIGWVGSYPDTPEWSECSGEAIMTPFEKFCLLWDRSSGKGIYDVVASMKQAGATAMSMEKYRAVLETGESLPQCKHCNQTIL